MKMKIVLSALVASGLALVVARSLAQQVSDDKPLEKRSSSSVFTQKEAIRDDGVGGGAGSQRQFSADVLQGHLLGGAMGGNAQGGGFGFGGSSHSPFASWLSPEEAKLAREAEQLAHSLRDAKSGSEKDKIKAQLGDVLEKQFERRQGRHEKEIEALESQVKKLKDLFQKRQENRREIIANRLDQIIRDADGLGW